MTTVWWSCRCAISSPRHERSSRTLLVAEELPVALVGRVNPTPVVGPEVLAWLDAHPVGDPPMATRERELGAIVHKVRFEADPEQHTFRI